MLDKCFAVIFEFLERRKRTVTLLFAAVTIACLLGFRFFQFESNFDVMLPDDAQLKRTMKFVKDSNLSNKLLVSVALKDPARKKEDLMNVVDRLTSSLRPPLYSKIVAGIQSYSSVMEEIAPLNYAPQSLSPTELAELDSRIEPESVSKRLKDIYMASLSPGSILLTSGSRADPLGMRELLIDKLRMLPSSMGYDVTIDNGHFISRDGKHALVIIETPVEITDSLGCGKIAADLKARADSLPDYVSCDIIGGHLHTASNEKVIKHDLWLASLITSLAFLVLFMAVFRDARVIIVFTIPMIAVVMSVCLAYLLLGKISYIVIGFGTAIAGISVDYSLHVYVARKRGASVSENHKLAKLLVTDAATTVSAFAALYLSRIKGYHQLAFFSIACTAVSLLLSIFILPITLRMKPSEHAFRREEEKLSDRRSPWLIVAVWALMTSVAIAASLNVRFDSDITKLDASEPEVFGAEKNFFKTWGGGSHQAILVVTGSELEEAMEVNDGIYQKAAAALGTDKFTSLSSFWSSKKVRERNIENWNRFWKDGRERKLRKLLELYSSPYGFSENAFSPFFEGLYSASVASGRNGDLFAGLKERFIIDNPDGYRILSFFPDEMENISTVKGIIERCPGAFIVSGKVLSQVIYDFTWKELLRMAPIAFLLNMVITFLFFRNFRETIIALVPLVTGIAWLLGIMSLLKCPLNITSISAAIITSGVTVDYGIGMTYEHRYNLKLGTVIAVSLSAVTTLIGAGALLFARGYAMFSTGLALVICIVAGYLSAVIVIPPLCEVMLDKRRRPPEE